MAFGVVSRVSLALCLLALSLVGIYIYKNTDVTVVQDFDKVIMESSSSLLEQITARYLSQELCILLAVNSVVRQAINAERRMGASLIRLFFHDCFVDGCDGGVLLDDIPGSFQGEKTSPPNNNSARGYFVIDQAKQRIRERCPRAAVSCADILAIAARDSVVLLGGLSYPVRLGRRDARTANFQAPLDQLPAPFDDVNTQVRKFIAKGMTIKEMVVLAGAHTIGFAKCTTLCDNRNINPAMQSTLRCNCPVNNDNPNLVQLDSTPGIIDKVYFDNLNRNQGLLFSDQVLMGNQTTADIVRFYSSRLLSLPFKIDFAAAMAKLGNLPPRPGVQLEIRNVCSRVN